MKDHGLFRAGDVSPTRMAYRYFTSSEYEDDVSTVIHRLKRETLRKAKEQERK
jgi:hypothetical protein